MSTIEELLERNSSGSGLESREYGRKDPLRWPRDTLYPQKLARTSPTSGGGSVAIVRSRTTATEFQIKLKTSEFGHHLTVANIAMYGDLSGASVPLRTQFVLSYVRVYYKNLA
jgi:hypothetical protein